MHGASLVWIWVAVLAGVAGLGFGLSLLVVGERRQWRYAGDRASDAWVQISLGTFILIETVPRVAHAGDALIATASIVAFAPLGLALAIIVSGRRRQRI